MGAWLLLGMLSGLVYNLGNVRQETVGILCRVGAKIGEGTDEVGLGQTPEANRSECSKGTVGPTEA